MQKNKRQDRIKVCTINHKTTLIYGCELLIANHHPDKFGSNRDFDVTVHYHLFK